MPFTTTLFLFLLCACLVACERTKRVFVHYLPWYDSEGIKYAKRTGWCYSNGGNYDCTDTSVIHYSNRPLIGEYSLFDTDVLEYHLLLMVATGIDGVVVNINPASSMQRDASLALFDRILELRARHTGMFDMKVIVSYDDSGESDTMKIQGYLQWTYDNIYDNSKYDQLIFRDDGMSNAPVYMTWSESNPAFYWTTLQSLFNGNVIHVVRNARSFQYSTANMEWINYLNQGQPMSNTANWGQQYFNSFDWLMARQSERGVPANTVNSLMFGNVYPGFDDVNVPPFWNGGTNRYILRDVDDGETMALTWQRHIDYTPQRLGGPDIVEDPWIQIATWNDWPEGTSVEPASMDTYGYRPLETCREKIAEFKGTSPSFQGVCLQRPFDIFQLRKAGSQTEADTAVTRLLSKNCA